MEKLTKIMVLILISMASVTVCSCLGDDDSTDDRMITPDEYAGYMTRMEGSYENCWAKFNNDTISKANKLDSVAVKVLFKGQGDSTLTVSGMPAKVLSRLVKDPKAKSVVEKMENTVQIRAKFYLYYKQDAVVYYGVYPYPLEVMAEYNGDLHTISFDFFNYVNTGNWHYNKMTQFFFYVGRVRIDGVTDNEFDYTNMLTNCILRFDCTR